MRRYSLLTIPIVTVTLSLSAAAWSQAAQDDDTQSMVSDPDPAPAPPGLESGPMSAKLEHQAGTGGEIAYAEQGVVELGGHGSFQLAEDIKQASLRPTVGWFVVDNLELSLIGEAAGTEIDVTDEDTGSTETDSETLLGLFAEPSFHMPFTKRFLGFIGAGLGVAYDSEETGFAVRPRLGVDVLIGRSGIFRPALEATYSTVDVVSQSDRRYVGVSSTYGISFGYSVML